MIFYISDTHFRDRYIFDKCRRPFSSLDEMEKAVVERWNRKVKDEDTVYVLGDIGTNNDPSSIMIFSRLNGCKHLIVGNHDHEMLEEIKKSHLFGSVKFIDLIEDSGFKVCLCHYPVMDWIEFNRGGALVYGHIHNKTEKNGHTYKQMKEYYQNLPAYNCGVDVTDFEPKTLNELINLKKEKENEPYIH